MSDTKGPILVVDDDEDVLEFLRTTLRGAGYDVVKASSAAGARRNLSQRCFALVLTDLRLPAASGLDLITHARELSPLTVGIVISGHGTVNSALEALREGAYDFLLKPCSAEVLLAAVRRAMEYHQLKSALLQKSAEVEILEGQLRHKSRLIHDVSHELRNPLSVVYGHSSLLLQRPAAKHEPVETERSLRSIHHNAERLNVLLDELIDSNRLCNGKVRLHKETLAASRLAAEAVENYRIDAEKRGLSLSAEASCDPGPMVFADPSKAHQILSNLITNALKFTPAGGKVTVSVACEGDGARFCVRDTGMGISPQDLPRIFDRFFQAENAQRSQPGLGLGLEICRGLVELHGGRIWAESRLGEGSSFYFTLPLAVPEPERTDMLETMSTEV